MSAPAQLLRAPATPAMTPAPSRLLQRSCACGGPAGFSGKCTGCTQDERLGVQPKLTVSQPGDPFEREADHVADQVMGGGPAPTVAPGISPKLQREEAAPQEDDDERVAVQRMAERAPEGDEDEQLQAKPGVGGSAAPAATFASGLAAARSGGSPLPAGARGFFEPRFGRALGHVRIHHGASAGGLARDINARAFTHGLDIYFAPGQYDPASAEGRRLLAHELTHTFQQGGGQQGAGQQGAGQREARGALVQRKALAEPAALATPTVRVPLDGPANPNEATADAAAAGAGQLHMGDPDAPSPFAARTAPSDAGLDLPPTLAALIQQPRGGTAMPAALRRENENRLGTGLDHVRVHQGPEAAALAGMLGARAFTYGKDVWLGDGERLTDRSLMAHELAHVAQQSPKPMEAPAEARVQAVRRSYYSLPRLGKGLKGPGDRSHDIVQDILGKDTGNAGMFSEVPIPGGAATGTEGRADFVKTDTGSYFGVTFAGADPKFLPMLSKSLRSGVKVTGHAGVTGNAAPAGNDGAMACKAAGLPAGKGICRMGSGPREVFIADLKPNYEAETLLGGDQVGRYITAVKALSTKTNAFATANPGLVFPAGGTWSPAVGRMKAVTIPKKHETPDGSSPRVMANLYVDEVQTRVSEESVLKIAKPSDGIITYEYIPFHMLGAGKAGAAATGGGAIADARTKLKPLKESLKEEPKRVATLRRPHAPRLAFKREKLEAKDEFNFAKWRSDKFSPWQGAAKTATGGEDNKALKNPSTEAEARLKDEADRQIAGRNSGVKSVPAGVLERTRELEAVQHWVNHGEKYGRLRQFFGSAYVRVVKAYDSIKAKIEQKVEAAKARMGKSAGSGGGIKGAVLATLRGIAGAMLGLFLRDIGNRLVTALQKGATKLLGSFFGDEIEAVEQQLKLIEEREAAFKKLIAETLEEKFGAEIAAVEEKLKEVEATAGTVKDIMAIVNLVKWAYRVAQCGAPPLLGCILGIVGSAAAEVIIAAVMTSCWFKREVAYPIISALGVVRRLPAMVADALATQIRKLLPESIKPLMGDVDMTDLASSPTDIDCDSEKLKLTPGQKKMAEMLEHYDDAHVDALSKALAHLGLDTDHPDPKASVTDEDIARVKAMLDKYSREKLEEIVKTTPQRPPRGGTAQDFVTDLDAVAAGGSQQPGSPQGGAAPTDAEKAREGEQIARLLKTQGSFPPGTDVFAPGDHQPGETLLVLFLKSRKRMMGGYQKITIVDRDDDKSMKVTLHAGTRFYDADGKLVETSSETTTENFEIRGKGPAPKAAPAKHPAPAGAKP